PTKQESERRDALAYELAALHSGIDSDLLTGGTGEFLFDSEPDWSLALGLHPRTIRRLRKRGLELVQRERDRRSAVELANMSPEEQEVERLRDEEDALQAIEAAEFNPLAHFKIDFRGDGDASLIGEPDVGDEWGEL